MAKREKADEPIDPRVARTLEFYMYGGAGFPPGILSRSMFAAGYSRATAKSNGPRFRRMAKFRFKFDEALRAQELDEVTQTAKLKQLREAKCVKWNSSKEKWDLFEDNEVQLRTTQEINKILLPQDIADTRPIQIIFPTNFGKGLTVSATGGDCAGNHAAAR